MILFAYNFMFSVIWINVPPQTQRLQSRGWIWLFFLSIQRAYSDDLLLTKDIQSVDILKSRTLLRIYKYNIYLHLSVLYSLLHVITYYLCNKSNYLWLCKYAIQLCRALFDIFSLIIIFKSIKSSCIHRRFHLFVPCAQYRIYLQFIRSESDNHREALYRAKPYRFNCAPISNRDR